MGNRSAKEEEAEEEDDEDDEAGEESDAEGEAEECLAGTSGSADQAQPIRETVVYDRSSVQPRPTKKKELPPDMADFSKLLAAKNAASAKAKAAAVDSAKRALAMAKLQAKGDADATVKATMDLPCGDVGGRWEALEDRVVSESRDVKSTKVGFVHAEEICVQTGPWRADSSGRVRMQVKTRAGVDGWLTVDARRCRNLEGTYGDLYMMFRGNAPPEEKSSEGTKLAEPKPQLSAKNEVDELLEIFGADVIQDEGSNGVANQGEDKQAGAKKAWRQRKAAERQAVANPGVCAEELEQPQQQEAVEQEQGPVVTESQKQLRNVRKKLRQAEGKGVATGRLAELQQLETYLEEQVSAEAAAKPATSAKKRKKKQNTAKAKEKGMSTSVHSRCSSTCMLMLKVALPVAVCAAAVYVKS